MSKPLHPKASGLQRAGLFAGLKSFDELETRITALPDERARGDAFEVFAEAYLATQRRHDLPQVWPLAAVPTDVLRKLALPLNDYGVDGVAQTALGGFDVYQVKFRSGRPPLTWRELSTFMGLADSAGIHSRVLFTNCDDLPAVMNERKGFFCIRGSDLDRLEESDFRAIESWLAQAQVPTARKQPRPHQHEALDVLLPALREHDRVTAIMACGTGKTLVALWVTERLEAKRVLVLLPSLALVRQTLHEWLHETSLPSLAYLCVCSDPTVKQDLDAIATPQSELDFPVTTDRQSVREFLDVPFAGAKIIFSTYQSARVVGEALRKGETFDLGIFDEAHKTAGREGRNYAFALEDSNLPIRKRLFLTATPRHYNPHRKDKEGDAQLVFSMDKPQVYGEQAYRLTFAEAARRGIICNYKVVISVITSGMVTNELLSRGEVLVNGDPIRARQVANQLALTDAIAKYGVNKVFTFHRTVKSAESFVADGSEGIGTHLAGVAAFSKHRSRGRQSAHSSVSEGQRRLTSAATREFQTFHVNGTMPTARRERVMRDFREASRAVMSNARCLTEGVDVPAVDMVAFLSPRRSRVDIVQATGRAMRRARDKTTGYVLVPLYLEQAADETVEQAVQRSEFDEVWNVLQAMQEQDDVLAEIIREMREERGRTKGFDDSRFREIVEVCGPSISLESLRTAITTMCVDVLGVSWDERFGELLAYKDEFKDCDVPFRHPKNRQLGIWAVAQRQAKKFGQLNERQIQLLNDNGFSWQLQTDWDEMFERLVVFKEAHGDCDVPQRNKEDPELGIWVFRQRVFDKAEKVSDERRRKLDSIGFDWKKRGTWSEMFQQLLEFQRKHGHCNVETPENSKLARWMIGQRSCRRNNKLTAQKIRRLDEIGFPWEVQAKNRANWGSNWGKMFEELVKFKAKHHHCNVPSSWKKNPQLANWVTAQRRAKKYKRKSFKPEHMRKLDEIRFVWDHGRNKLGWEKMFSLLEEYKNQKGDCNVPHHYPANPQLGWWVHNQRSRKLSEEKIRRLNEIGFQWEIQKGRRALKRP